MAARMKVRQQGGARIVTLPRALLSQLGADTGTTLSFTVQDGALIARPVSEAPRGARRRYTLAELLAGSEETAALNEAMAPAREGAPVGREII